MKDLPLFHHFPQSTSLPWVELATLPTDCRASEDLRPTHPNVDFWIKDDSTSGALYGGNKVRKLEFLLGEAIAENATAVVTVGAIGSHHALATSIYAREFGLIPHVLQFPQPITEHVRKNFAALWSTNPTLTLLSRNQLPAELFKVKVGDWLNRNPEIHYIPGGGSSPIGVLGYVNAAVELAEQIERGACQKPNRIYVAAGTCGTLAGLVLGFKMMKLDIDVVGVRVVDRIIANKPATSLLANRCGGLLRDAGVKNVPKIRNSDFRMLHGFLGKDYGVPTEAGLRATEEVQDVSLEPTYTAKAFAGMREDVPNDSGETILYWHTLSGVDLTERAATADMTTISDAHRTLLELT